MEFRTMNRADLPQVMEIIAQAQRGLRLQGIDQWQDGYPDVPTLEADIQAHNAWVAEEAGQVAGCVVISFDGEPNYDSMVEGCWKEEGAYAVIHRIAVCERWKGQGVAGQMLRLAEKLCAQRQVEIIRVDTHRDNRPMRRLLEKNGYHYRGVIRLSRDQSLRVAYEKNRRETMDRAEREWELLNRIGFERVGGTEQEEKAAEILRQEAQRIGARTVVEAFEVQDQIVHRVECRTPDRTFPATAYGCGGVTGEEGLTAGFSYMEYPDAVSRADAKGKIVLVNGYLSYKLYQEIVSAGAVGFITYSGEMRDRDEDTDLVSREMRPQLAELAQLPGVHLRIQDAFDLVRDNPETVTLTVCQTKTTGRSHNVIAQLDGSDRADEVIVLTAHYDSVQTSTGVYDNGAGSVILMELLRSFALHRPRRTLRFIWCGSEERGLLGSHAYVQQHREQLDAVRLNINVDVAGAVLGHDSAWCLGEDDLPAMVRSLARECGFVVEVKRDVYSSDEVPFSDLGIPSVSFMRFGERGANYIHNRHDVLRYLSPQSLARTTDFIEQFLRRIDQAEVFPLERSVPQGQKEKIDLYLNRKTKEDQSC